MTLSMYDATVPGFIRTLGNLSAIIDKAIAYAEARKIDPSVLVNARLAPDMSPFSRQIQIATDGVKGCAGRLGEMEIPSYPDTETTLEALKERIAKTIAFLQSVPAETIAANDEMAIHLKFPNREMHFTAKDYVFGFVIPNFYFHVTTAYALLRHNGLEIGKMDYLGAV